MPKHDSCCEDEWPVCKWRHLSEAGQYETRFLFMLMIRLAAYPHDLHVILSGINLLLIITIIDLCNKLERFCY